MEHRSNTDADHQKTNRLNSTFVRPKLINRPTLVPIERTVNLFTFAFFRVLSVFDPWLKSLSPLQRAVAVPGLPLGWTENILQALS